MADDLHINANLYQWNTGENFRGDPPAELMPTHEEITVMKTEIKEEVYDFDMPVDDMELVEVKEEYIYSAEESLEDENLEVIKSREQLLNGSREKTNEWTINEDEILIDFIRIHECLFSINCKEYRNMQLKQSLWNEIGERLNKTANDCNKRWSYIRDYYVRRRGKPSGGEAAKKRSKQLSFLDSISSIKRNTFTNIDSIKCQNDLNTSENSSQKNTGEQDTIQSVYLSTGENTNDLAQSLDAERNVVQIPLLLGKLKRTAHKRAHAEERLRLLKQIAEKQEQAKEEDENDLFFRSMSIFVKKLPKAVQARLRMKIGSLIGHAEIENLSTESNPDYRPSSAGSSTSNTAHEREYFLNL